MESQSPRPHVWVADKNGPIPARGCTGDHVTSAVQIKR